VDLQNKNYPYLYTKFAVYSSGENLCFGPPKVWKPTTRLLVQSDFFRPGSVSAECAVHLVESTNRDKDCREFMG
jgi:hypothetical protein